MKEIDLLKLEKQIINTNYKIKNLQIKRISKRGKYT